ncbi:MAG: translocation/assembly module TamB [Bacteroidetes bacterium QS_3_64_15]|nr:MAG: translocation/assembly module TamB [Bacteroidetes bacterium QS_3_64_15]
MPRPFWRSLRVVLGAVLVGIVIFVGFTRTQVGRDAIRAQVETTFNQRFEGQLSIASLSGTVIDEVVATDIQLRDPSGTVVATIDSIRGTPRWANLLTAELSLRTLTLVRPQLSLDRDSSGTWNVRRVFRRRNPSSPNQPLDVTVANVEVQDGRVTTTRQGYPPEVVRDEWLFDYTRTEVTDIALAASVQRAGPSGRLEINTASFTLPDADLQTSLSQGKVRRTETGWSLRDLALSLGGTSLRGRASLRSSGAGESPAPVGQNALSLELSRSRIDNDELRRLVPRLPFADVVTVQGMVEGSLDQLRASDVTVTHDSSFATLDGTVAVGTDALTLDARLRKSRLTLDDIRDVWPGMPALPTTEIGPLNLEGTLRGTTAPPGASEQTFDLDAQIAARSPHGTVQGSLAVARPSTSSLTYSTSLTADSLNLAPLTGRPSLTSRLNGRVEVEGAGTKIDSLQGTMDLSLSASRIGGRPLASADGQVRLEEGRAQGTLTVRQTEGGRLFLKGSGEELSTRSSYNVIATSSGLDLASLSTDLPSTALNARLTLGASGTEWQPLSGTAVLEVDTSRVTRGDSTVVVPPHSATLRLADRNAEQPRIQITGGVATLTADGSSLGPPLWTTARAWGDALQDAVRRARNKPAPSQVRSPMQFLRSPTSVQQSPRPPAFTQLELSSRIDAQASLRVHRPEILNAWWPSFPRQAEQLSAEATLTTSADTLHSTGRASVAHLETGATEAQDLKFQYTLSGRPGAPLAQSMTATAELSARRVAAGGPSLENASASLSYDAGTGTLDVRADSVGIAASLRLTSDLHVTPTTNELRVRQVSVDVHGNTWTNASSASVFAYSDALVVGPFILQEPHPETPSLQQVRVSGTVSARPTDTLSVEATNVYLPPLSGVTGLPHVLGGNLDAQFRLRSGWGRPMLTGDLSVRRLSYDRRYLGDAYFRAEYSAQSPDLVVNGSLEADGTTADRLAGPDLVPNGIRTADPNSLSLSGRVRLPQWAYAGPSKQSSRIPDGETLDLSAEVDRADLFFFRYIFEERVSRIQGYLTGPLHIGGRFQDPTFDADLRIENGAVTLPLFGLEYEAEGPLRVDRKGIHTRELQVQDDEGTATVDGSILFNEYQYFSFDLSASLDGITVIDVPQAKDLPFYGNIRSSGPLTLTGPLSDATLRSSSVRTTPDSELFIPVSGETIEEETGFVVFADSTGQTPSLQRPTRRPNILADRPDGVPTFVEGLNIDLNVTAPEESTVHLVFDPIVGDVLTAVGSGRVQLQRGEGALSVYGNFNASSGTYQFTAGEVFVRRFDISRGTITWDGSPTNARLDLDAEYRTRASPSGLPGFENAQGRIPVTVELNITGRVATPRVDLGLSLTRSDQRNLVGSESLDAILNQPARTTEYATSVLLTNTFLLTTESITRRGGTETGDGRNRLTTAGNQLAFNSVSQLVSSQLNRYLGKALPNVDLNVGVQGEDPNNLDLIYAVALRLLNERLVIRGEGLYTGDNPDAERAQGPQGEFVVEVRLSSSVSAKVFYRRTGDELTQSRALTSSRGAGVSYQTQFSTWRRFFDRFLGWMIPSGSEPDEGDESSPEAVAGSSSAPSDSASTSGEQR